MRGGGRESMDEEGSRGRREEGRGRERGEKERGGTRKGVGGEREEG